MFNDVEERALMERMARGDPDAFEALYGRYARAVGHFLYRLCYDEALAEDCLQETFLRVWGAARQWRGEAKVSTFIFQVARNAGLDARARAGRERARGGRADAAFDAAAEPVDEAAGPVRRLEGAELRAIVRRAIESLPEEQREVLALVQTEGLTYREAAEILHLPLGTAKSRMAAAAESLRRRLERYARE